MYVYSEFRGLTMGSKFICLLGGQAVLVYSEDERWREVG